MLKYFQWILLEIFLIINLSIFQLRSEGDDRGVQCGRASDVMPVYCRCHHSGKSLPFKWGQRRATPPLLNKKMSGISYTNS